jgi:hypothetical protein
MRASGFNAAREPAAIRQPGPVGLGQLQQGEALGKRVFSMIVQNHDREFVRGYVHDPTADLAFYGQSNCLVLNERHPS